MKNPVRKFRDLIMTASSMWPVWQPDSPAAQLLEAGDYGTVDRDGEFHREGNIFQEPGFEGIVNASAPEPMPLAEDQMVIVSKTARMAEFAGGPEFEAALTNVAFKGAWSFGRHSGAVMVLHRPRQWSLPSDPNVEAFLNNPKLKGKCVVKDVWKCSAYAYYLAEKGNNEISLALSASSPMAMGISSTGAEASGKWASSYGAGVYQAVGMQADSSDALHTVLYTLKKPKRHSLVAGWREDINRDKLLVGWMQVCNEDIPWAPLDDDGEEEKDKDMLYKELASLSSDDDDAVNKGDEDDDDSDAEIAKQDA